MIRGVDLHGAPFGDGFSVCLFGTEIEVGLLDVPNRSLWVETTPATSYQRLEGSRKADVVVVGGGITGLTAAVLLAREGASVVLLEAQRIASGATGFTTGKVTSLHSLTYADLIEWVGIEKAGLYGAANEAAIAQIAELVQSFGIECQFTRAPAYTYTMNPAKRSTIDNEVAAAQLVNLPASFADETDLPYSIEAAVRFDNQAHFHPRRYVLGLASAFEALGGVIFEQSRVVGIDEHDGGVNVKTGGGSIRGRAAVVGTLLPFLDIGGYFAKAHPSRSYALSARCSEKTPLGMYFSIDSPSRSIRPVDVDGAAGVILGGPSHKPGHVDSTESYYAELEAWGREAFDIEAVDYRWSAQDYVSVDRIPYIGRCPRTTRVFVGTGYKKWGITGGTVAGVVITDLINGRDNPWLEVFDATRIGDIRSAKTFTKENALVGMHFVKDRIERLRAGDISEIKPGQGGIVRRDHRAIGVYRALSGDVDAVSVTCTHLGCTLKWNSAETSWDCPCHGSRFSHTGEVIEGPAIRPLARVPIEE